MECINPFALEKNLKKKFDEQFKLIAGNEYYEGNENNMKIEFLKIVCNYDTQLKECNIEQHKCIKCSNSFYKKDSLVRHMRTCWKKHTESDQLKLELKKTEEDISEYKTDISKYKTDISKYKKKYVVYLKKLLMEYKNNKGIFCKNNAEAGLNLDNNRKILEILMDMDNKNIAKDILQEI